MEKRIEQILLKVKTDEVGERIDSFLSSHEESLTRSAATRLIESGAVSVNGRPTTKNYKVREGDEITLDMPEPTEYEAEPENIPLDIVYEDSDIIVVNKPEGMVVHPAAGNETGTLVNALLYHCGDSLSGIGGVIRPGIVHRIDKDTSGLLVVAKNDAAHLSLSEQMKSHGVSRVYHAIVHGGFKDDKGTVDAPIGRHPVDRKKMAVIKNADLRSRDAVTHYEVLERFSGYTYIKCVLETGRTHQIRVHMSSLGHPLVGDEVYGRRKSELENKNKSIIHGQCLHAKELSLTHPRTGERMHFSSELPENMSALLDKLRKTE